MAVDVSEGNRNMAYAADAPTYAAAIALVKYGTAGLAALLVLRAIFLF